MAKLTLAFKDRKLKIFALPAAGGTIGRDTDCLIVIDSLAVAPQHARIATAGERVTIEPWNVETPVQVNGVEISTPHPLEEGDQIAIGKHTLSFSAESEGTVLEPAVVRLPTTGWLQILNGSHLGRTIRLDKAFTRIGKSDTQLAVIARRDDGYYLSHLQGEPTPSLNNHDIGDATCKLNNEDEISVGELRVQFYSDSQASPEEEHSDIPPHPEPQRRFSRIPFDVPATLSGRQGQYQTCLIDISLHGALIKVPADFSCTQEEDFQLSIHLEGGPDICMEVAAAHHENEQLGLRCRDIDVDSITCLRRLIELNLGDPELLERELSALG